jgi:hypothetical protein
MCVMSPSAGTNAGGLHVELCVPNENHRTYCVETADKMGCANDAATWPKIAMFLCRFPSTI